jgi:hypothetical protein
MNLVSDLILEMNEKLTAVEKAMGRPVRVYDAHGLLIREKLGDQMFRRWFLSAAKSGEFVTEVRKKFHYYVGSKMTQEVPDVGYSKH